LAISVGGGEKGERGNEGGKGLGTAARKRSLFRRMRGEEEHVRNLGVGVASSKPWGKDEFKPTSCTGVEILSLSGSRGEKSRRLTTGPVGGGGRDGSFHVKKERVKPFQKGTTVIGKKKRYSVNPGYMKRETEVQGGKLWPLRGTSIIQVTKGGGGKSQR